MTDELITGLVESLRRTLPFQSLAVTNRPHEALWRAHNETLLALRLPLYHARLGRARPKPKGYDTAIQAGLAILGAFAHVTGTRQAIVQDRQRAASGNLVPATPVRRQLDGRARNQPRRTSQQCA